MINKIKFKSILYRPEIDGLRAVSVIAVILYHAKIYIPNLIIFSDFFSGGFIGVDIFFVISGYLISKIIITEIKDTGKFSFKFFYERRIRRIIPLLLFVILCSLSVGWFILMPFNLVDLSKASLSSIGFSSNIYFYLTGLEYWAEDKIPNVLLHTWSLAVEEQYYIFVPILLLLSLRFFKNYLLLILIIIFLTSLGYSEIFGKNNPSATFYFIHTRIWELMCGSLIAYCEIYKIINNSNRFLNNTMPLLGIILIIFSFLFFNDRMNHPSLITIFPIIGASLIILYSSKNEFITKILSTRLFVSIGLISYSLYLWHYPIFNYVRLNDLVRGVLVNKIYLAVFTFAISIISYYLIEKPFRNRKINFKYIISIIFLVITTITIFSFLIIKNDGYKKRFSFENINISNKNFTFDSRKYYEEMESFQLNYNYNKFSPEKKNVIIIGNSHGEDIFKIFTYSKYVEDYYFYIPSELNRKPEFNYQLDYFKEDLRNIRSNKFDKKNKFLSHFSKQYNLADFVIIATNFDKDSIDTVIKDIPEINNIILKDGKKLILFDQALRIKGFMSNRFNRFDYFVFKEKRFPTQNEKNLIEKQVFQDSKNVDYINYHLDIIGKNNSIRYFKRNKIFCDMIKEICPVLTNYNDKIYWDKTHITKEGAKYFAEIFNNIDFFN